MVVFVIVVGAILNGASYTRNYRIGDSREKSQCPSVGGTSLVGMRIDLLWLRLSAGTYSSSKLKNMMMFGGSRCLLVDVARIPNVAWEGSIVIMTGLA